MKVHAWFNPYRVSTNTKPSTIAALNRTSSLHPSSVYVLHPEWIRTSGIVLFSTRAFPRCGTGYPVVMEVVNHYPVDGVQFDDYFYTETPGSPE